MKKIITFICFVFFTVSSFAIKVENNQILDDYGNKIEAKEYKKIIVTDPGVIEILFKIGGEKSIVAIAKTSRSKIHPSDKVDKLVSIGNVSNLNLEKVVEYKPDLIVVSSMMLRNVEAIKKMGYKVIVSNASNLNGILDVISVTGIISGKKDEAEKLRKECSLKLEKIEKENSKKTSKLKGAILFSTSPMSAFSENSIPGDVLKHLGVINIAANVPGQRPILSPEYILKENPDFLAGAMSLDDPQQIIEASNVIPKIKAGKNNNIFILDSSVILRSSYRIFDEMEVLKEKLNKIENK
ncbi:oligopeptide ABC transporter, oligopeptide-binding protein [Fusobacterium sp. CM21]|uniref:ABC transporter substrate-binding protein n=1 Tax=Fusobacterium vincentii TaxID=155615 RepID=A0AAJ1CS64_FUSVC|nr:MULTISPECIES: ABC transporter substrate-binding protein [Fusobacterium]ETT01857.1 oligopeptide ABC transporter, oligopeptide-binding protein [Fusobacterium sp. CM21]ERT45904.1 iron complex transport system substrate-binding protein [Fusobacterium nucleatum CTI-7]MCW0263260.1 ABC transporter substrate-binding protein [Fusobacterium vincentii]OFL31780.1 hemin receptor [Fusobacterium sp. HMSC064B12]OHU83312.1 hemin receptor [Fusobacterium nucleatum]